MRARPGTTTAADVPLVAGLVLLVGTGFVDSYTFLAHGHVFAEAMTGNLVLIGIGVVEPEIVEFWRPLAAYAAFVVGVALLWWIAGRRAPATRAPQVATLTFEVAVLVVVGFLPSSVPQVVTVTAIAFASGMQIAAFQRLGLAKFTTTVMTSNSLHTVNAALTAWSSGTRQDRLVAVHLAAGLVAFMVGVLGGALLTDVLEARASWVAAGVFAVSGLLLLRPARSVSPNRSPGT
jgi:uncharacterized membrane protein YoaK (UPF0700 family)